MTELDMDEAMSLEYFCRVVVVSTHKEVKELREAHDPWESFEGALLEGYGYAKPEGQVWIEFDQWVASIKAHQSAMVSFQEFEHRFAQLSKRDRRSVGGGQSPTILEVGPSGGKDGHSIRARR